MNRSPDRILMFMILAIACGLAGTRVEAATRCSTKSADGTGPNIKVAKFQVYEGLLRAEDQALWSAWMTAGTTPGYRVGQPVYVCRAGMGLGVSCRGTAKICRRDVR
jgi:hypothetical protein